MSAKISRRKVLLGAGAAGAASVLLNGTGTASLMSVRAQEPQSETEVPQSSLDLLREHEDHTIVMVAGDMVVHFDRRYGSISSITRKNDPFATNYIGNELNTPGVDPSDSRWTGDVVATVWQLTTDNWQDFRLGQNDVFRMSGRWKRELTGRSADIRRVNANQGIVNVTYDGVSSDEEGIHSYSLSMSFKPGGGNSLLWDTEITNTSGKVLEIGEFGFPLMVNDDYSELYIENGAETKLSTVNNVDFGKTPIRQKLIHEQKILSHAFIAGHSSYVLLQRPLGDSPFLLVHPTMDTSFECIYKEPQTAICRTCSGLAGTGHSCRFITRNQRSARMAVESLGQRALIPHSSARREKTVSAPYRIHSQAYQAIRDEIYQAGNLGIRILPSMVVQEGSDVYVELLSKSDIDLISLLSDNIQIKDKKRVDDKTLLTLSFKGRGQKSMKLHYAGNRWTNLHFYCIEDIEQLLKARGQFVVDRQFYKNPDDPYHRYHCFLPFDHRIGSIFLDSDEVWEVGGSDESGFSEPLFLSEKNVYLPSREEVDALEAYVADCLFKYIQNPETYEVRASLYWKDRYPSDGWGAWTKQRSEATFRSYNYVHPANIYYALYRIGKSYGLLTKKTHDDYLRMSYKTCLKWFTTGPWKHVGLMEGSNAVHILDAVRQEGWMDEYNETSPTNARLRR